MKFANLKKITSILILIIVINCAVPIVSRATSTGIEFNADDLSQIYDNQDDTYNEMGAKIIGLAQFICYTAAVVILLYKGMQFMLKSPDAKAEAKKELLSYVIGAVIIFAIGTLIKIIGNITLKLF